MHKSLFPILLLFLFITPQFLAANPVVIDFEGLADLDAVTTQYPGLTFTNAIVLTSGISLNEFEFPPHSGDNVISDDGGPISIIFATPITDFTGFFTYMIGLTLTAFDINSNQVGQVTSLYGSNLALSGDPGSNPNEILGLNFAGGFSSISITGDLAGSSFVLDDVTYSSSTPVPEPSSITLLLAGGLALFLGRKKLFI